MTTELFVDTSAWARLFVANHDGHSDTTRIVNDWRREGGLLLTTNYIITELVSLMTSPLRIPRHQTIRVIERLCISPSVEIVHVDEALHAAGWALLKDRADKDWSLVDCVSFAVMERRGLTEALTSDHHFEQAGYRRLLQR